MRLHRKTEGQKLAEHNERVRKRETWRRWFAWHPVQLEDGTWVWLETVERRFVQGSPISITENPWVAVYRLP